MEQSPLKDHSNLNRAITAKGELRQTLWAEIAEYRKTIMQPIVDDWREQLISDNWTLSKIYDHELLEHAWRATREGFVISGLSRPIPSQRGEIPKPDLHAWGPDGAGISLPEIYSFAAIKARMRYCRECGNRDIETGRFAFANRCCAPCGDKFMKSLPSNWCD
jgi:hypothetical protein